MFSDQNKSSFIKFIKKFINRIIYDPFGKQAKIWKAVVANNHPYPAIPSKETVALHEQYWSSRADRHNKKVIYTCITGGYDQPIMHAFLDFSYDYICYSDDPKLLDQKHFGAWEIRPLVFTELTKPLQNRWHKMFPDVLFPEYECSVYVDGNCDVLDDFLFRMLEKGKDHKLFLPTHFINDCIYKEMKDVLKNKREKPENVEKMRKIIVEANFPHEYGQTENNIIFRHHHDPVVREIMQEWWGYVKDVVARDQLSFSFVLWKHQIKLEDIEFPNARMLPKSFRFYIHQKSK